MYIYIPYGYISIDNIEKIKLNKILHLKIERQCIKEENVFKNVSVWPNSGVQNIKDAIQLSYTVFPHNPLMDDIFSILKVIPHG